MRKVKINETEEVPVHASSMTCYLYEKEFDGRDIVSDVAAMGESANFGILRKCLWAMMKTANPATVPPYSVWMQGTCDLDYQNTDWMAGVMQEAKGAFFRGAAATSTAG